MSTKTNADAKKGDLVLIKSPQTHMGKMARISGSYFKYPGQSFYVFPGKLVDCEHAGAEVLISDFSYVDKESQEKHESKYGFVVSLENDKIYDYQKSLSLARCRTCEHILRWQVSLEKEDDRFCYAECCGIRYSMVPETVRILWNTTKEIAEMDDDDFFKELQNLQ